LSNFRARAINFTAIKPRALFSIADNVAGRVQIFKALLGLFVAGEKVGMRLLCQAAEGGRCRCL
jgi:hypothetical protein